MWMEGIIIIAQNGECKPLFYHIAGEWPVWSASSLSHEMQETEATSSITVLKLGNQSCGTIVRSWAYPNLHYC